MTGNGRDVPTQEKALSIALSVLMVLSVVAIGMAGFAGSAVAASQSDTDGLSDDTGIIFADPANASTQANHTIQVQVGSDLGNINNTESNNITIEYQNSVDLGNLNNVTGSGTPRALGGDITTGNTGLNLFVNDTQITNANVSFGSNTDRIEINATNNVNVSNGDILTIELGVNDEAIINPSQASTNVNINVPASRTAVTDTTVTPTLNTGEGPIEVTGSGETFFFNTFARGVQNATNGDRVTVTEDLDETLPSSFTETGNATVQADNVIIEGTNTPVVNTSGTGVDPLINVSGSQNVTIDGIEFQANASNSRGGINASTEATGNFPTNLTVSNNIFDGFGGLTLNVTAGDVNNNDATLSVSGNNFRNDGNGAINLNTSQYSSGDQINVINNDIAVSSGGNPAIRTSGDASGGGSLSINQNGNTIDSSSTGSVIGIRLNSPLDSVDINGGTVNGTAKGINISNSQAGGDINITDTRLTNIDDFAVNVSHGTDSTTRIVGIAVDSAPNATGVNVTEVGNSGTTRINNASINDTDTGILVSDSDDRHVLNITSSEVTNADSAGLEFDDDAGNDFGATASLNTFESNSVAIDVNTDFSGSERINLTFNDFIDNQQAAIDTTDGALSGSTISAEYSFFGDSTGPNGRDQVPNAHGNGDNVTVTRGSDVSVYPFLTESIDEFSNPELNGNKFVVLENPQFPIASTSNNQAIGVTVLESGNSQANTNNVVIEGPTGQRTLSSGTRLNFTTVDQFNLSSNVDAGNVEIAARSKADGINDGSVTQTVTGQFNASTSTITDDNSQLQSGQTVNFTLQLNDDAGNAHEHQGVRVDFTSQNFGTAGVQFTDRETNTSNDGIATATIAANGLNPGEDFTVRAFVGPDDDLFERTLTTATGAIDAGSSRLLLNDQPTDPATQQVNTTHDLAAQINDSQANALSGETVTFSSNASGVSFESTDVTTDSDGFANTTVTLPTDVGTVAVNASAGNFNADTTGSARINVSTKPADASQLNVSDVSIAPGNSNSITVSVQDEFGNLNTSQTPDITLNTSDQSVISIGGQQEVTNTSTSSGQATFTVTAESDSGSATLTASASGLTADTATASIAEVGGVSLTADDSSIINDANSDNATNFTAEVTDADGNVIQTNESIRFTRVTSSSDAAASSTGAFQVFSGDDGTVTTFRANATGTGDTTFRANIPGTSFSDTATITSTGTADGLTIEANQSTVTAGDKVQINLSVVDTGDRVVPVSRSLSVDTTLGTLDSSGAATTVSTTDGEANVTLNATEAGTASVSVANSGLQTSVSTSITVEEQEQQPTADITFDDQGVQNGSATVNIASATFNGTENFTIVVHRASDTDGDGEIEAANDEIGQKIGESEALEPGSEPKTDITVNLSEQAAADDDVEQFSETGEQTLVAMLHTTNTSDGDDILNGVSIKRNGTPVFDQATIGVSPLENPAAAQFDDDGDGEITVDNLAEAGREFARQDIGVQDLAAVGRAFARSQT